MDEKVVTMEKERDWFRGEALNLNISKKKLEKEVTELRTRLRQTIEDRDYFEINLHEEKMNNR
jgi:predicted ATP-grasp superfamily ATP-dependent carboligase